MGAQPWPPLHAYALAHRCSTCGAAAGAPCVVPRKQASVDRRNRALARLGRPPAEPDAVELMHARRQDAGQRHYRRDVGRAPWAEDREPGRRYDSLGDAWTPEA